MQYYICSLSHYCYWLWPNDALRAIQIQDFSAFLKILPVPGHSCLHDSCLHCTLNLKRFTQTEHRRWWGKCDHRWSYSTFKRFILFILLYCPGHNGHLSSMGDRVWELCVWICESNRWSVGPLADMVQKHSTQIYKHNSTGLHATDTLLIPKCTSLCVWS